jgi:hypothetical protein
MNTLPSEKLKLRQSIQDGQDSLGRWLREQEIVLEARQLYEDALNILFKPDCIYWRRLEPLVRDLNYALENGQPREKVIEEIKRIRLNMDWLKV